MLLEDVFRYRTLLGKCELGFGLEWEEIEEISSLERAFAPRETRRGRKFRRAQVELVGILRGDKINDRVAVVELGPGGLVCRRAPFVARGEQVEIVIDRPGFAGSRSTAEGQCGGLIDRPGFAGSRSTAEGQCGGLIDRPGFAGSRSTAEGQCGGLIDRPGFAGSRSTAEGQCGGLIDRPGFAGEGQIEEGERSYRFSAQGVWLKDDGDDYRIGLALVGMPVCLTRHAISRHQADLVDRIGVAA